MSTTYTARLEETQRDMNSYFDKSASVVRDNFERFEKQYGRPAINYSAGCFETHPLTSSFVAVFAVLSLVPVITFIGFSLFMITTVTVIATVLSLITITVLEILFLTILLITLTGALILALILTPALLSTYLAFRLFIHVRSDGRAGASEWASETKKQFIPSGKIKEATEGSEGSIVVVGEDSPKSEKPSGEHAE